MTTHLAALACIHRLTGRAIRLQPHEEVVNSKIEPDSMTVLINRVWTQDSRRGDIVTHTGSTLYLFHRQPDDSWFMFEPITVKTKCEPILCTAWVLLTPQEVASRKAWEDLAYRVGTPDDPRDSTARQAQGYWT